MIDNFSSACFSIAITGNPLGQIVFRNVDSCIRKIIVVYITGTINNIIIVITNIVQKVQNKCIHTLKNLLKTFKISVTSSRRTLI